MPPNWGFNIPPGPPGFSRMCLSPAVEAFFASILMIDIENVLSDDLLKWSIGTSSWEPSIFCQPNSEWEKNEDDYIGGYDCWPRRTLPIAIWRLHWSSEVPEIPSPGTEPPALSLYMPSLLNERRGHSGPWYRHTSCVWVWMRVWVGDLSLLRWVFDCWCREVELFPSPASARPAPCQHVTGLKLVVVLTLPSPSDSKNVSQWCSGWH
jgi:hypothetical protein